MQTISITALIVSLGPLFAAASAVPRQDSSYSFTMYQSTDCSGTSEGTISNGDNTFPLCSNKLGSSLGSVMVTSNANGKCKISFYDDGNHANCYNSQANQPNYQLGTCFRFDSSDRPTYYGVACQSS